jgi:hypothetical protein
MTTISAKAADSQQQAGNWCSFSFGAEAGKKLTRIFHENALASATPSPQERTWVSERTTIKWSKYLTFRRFPAASCRELQLLSRDRETGNPLAGLSGA